jgi:hypothetical protein
MLLVIFGAGASFDCGPLDRPARPFLPLTADLISREYRPIAQRYRGCMPVIDYLEHATRDSSLNLEQALDRFADDDPVRHTQLIAFRFYLCEMLTHIENIVYTNAYSQTFYMSLLNSLARWRHSTQERVALLTFNYDTLIERAAEDVVTGWNLHGRGYVERDDWTLVKLHGSLGWSRAARYERSLPILGGNAERALAVADQLAVSSLPFVYRSALQSDDYTDAPTDDFAAEQASPTRPVLIPAISVPLEAKTQFECPTEHVNALRAAIPQVDRVLICGWRATDRHAVELLGNSGLQHDCKLAIVAKDDGTGQGGVDETLHNLGDLLGRDNLVFETNEGMTDLIKNQDRLLPRLLRKD